MKRQQTESEDSSKDLKEAILLWHPFIGRFFLSFIDFIRSSRMNCGRRIPSKGINVKERKKCRFFLSFFPSLFFSLCGLFQEGHALICKAAAGSHKRAPQSPLLIEHWREAWIKMAFMVQGEVSDLYIAQQCLRTGNKRLLWYKQPQYTHTLSVTLWITHTALDSHTVQVNELTLALVALGGQEVFKVFDLLGQFRVQIELGWKLRDPVPGGQNKGMKRERGTDRGEQVVRLVYAYTVKPMLPTSLRPSDSSADKRWHHRVILFLLDVWHSIQLKLGMWSLK